MDARTGASQAVVGSPPRIELTLSGVRVLPHPKNPPELAGVLVPWMRIERTPAQHGAVQLKPLDDQGRPYSAKGRGSLAFTLAGLKARTASRLLWRSQGRVLKTGKFDLVEQVDRSANRALFWLMGVMLAVLAVLMSIKVCTPSGGPAWTAADLLQGACFTLLAMSPIGLMVGLVMFSSYRTGFSTIESVRVANDGFEAELLGGELRTHGWSEVREVKLWGGIARVHLADGSHMDLPVRRTAYVFAHVRDQLLKAQRRWKPLRIWSLALRLFLYHQAAGGLGYAILTWLNAPSVAIPPLRAYLLIGWGPPLVLVMIVIITMVIPRWCMRQGRARARAARRAEALSSGG